MVHGAGGGFRVAPLDGENHFVVKVLHAARRAVPENEVQVIDEGVLETAIGLRQEMVPRRLHDRQMKAVVEAGKLDRIMFFRRAAAVAPSRHDSVQLVGRSVLGRQSRRWNLKHVSEVVKGVQGLRGLKRIEATVGEAMIEDVGPEPASRFDHAEMV